MASTSRPDLILARIDPPTGYFEKVDIPNLLDQNGDPQLDANGHPIRDFAFLPRHLPAKLSGLDMAAYFRKSFWLTHEDLWARQPIGTPFPNTRRKNALNMLRLRQGALPNNARAWSKKYEGRPTKILVSYVEELSNVQLAHNIAWTITPNGVHPPGDPTFLTPLAAFGSFLENDQPHTPSEEILGARKESRRLNRLAKLRGKSHWSALDKADLPRGWSVRVKKSKRTNELSEHNEKLEEDTDSFLTNEKPTTESPSLQQIPAVKARIQEPKSPQFLAAKADHPQTAPAVREHLQKTRSQETFTIERTSLQQRSDSKKDIQKTKVQVDIEKPLQQVSSWTNKSRGYNENPIAGPDTRRESIEIDSDDEYMVSNVAKGKKRRYEEESSKEEPSNKKRRRRAETSAAYDEEYHELNTSLIPKPPVAVDPVDWLEVEHQHMREYGEYLKQAKEAEAGSSGTGTGRSVGEKVYYTCEESLTQESQIFITDGYLNKYGRPEWLERKLGSKSLAIMSC